MVLFGFLIQCIGMVVACGIYVYSPADVIYGVLLAIVGGVISLVAAPIPYPAGIPYAELVKGKAKANA